MMSPFQSEPCFANLFALLSQAQMLTLGVPNGNPAFVTTSRQAQPVANVSSGSQPAMFLMQGEIEFGAMDEVGLSIDKYKAAAIVYFTNPGGSAAASPQLNALRDAMIYAIRQQTLSSSGAVIPLILGERQTLGGVCYHACFDGRALANEGLQNNQGAAVFPITILTGV
jgi:hypothetical protein